MQHLSYEAALSGIPARVLEILRGQPRAVVAIDGMAASGKTTLCSRLQQILPGCAVVHMDDFIMPFDKRFPGYFDAQLSNAETDRFDREVLTPFLMGKGASYRPYVCHPEPGYLDAVQIDPGARVLLIEGAYCLHPDLFDRYDLRMLSLIDPALQEKRVLARNGAEQLERYLSMWIPMENRHIEARRLREICDFCLTAQ